MRRLDLLSWPPFAALLRNRVLQLAVLGLALAGYVYAIVAGVLGSPVGSSNFTIVIVWIGWWAVLILLAVPMLGRGWCSICPIPVPGEWLQRRALLGPVPGISSRRSLRWPRQLRGIWIQTSLFLLLALFSTHLLTSPFITAIALAALLVMAMLLSVLFERRAFCRYVCPVGGFIGLYSQAAPLALRAKDPSLCAACVGKPCYNGSGDGYGCPWDVFPPGLNRNSYCGLCMECLRTCPQDNISIQVRRFGADLNRPSARLDEAFKSFVMLGAVLTYSAVLLGPWGGLKRAAYQIGTAPWFIYAIGFVLLSVGVLPGLFALCSFPGADAPAFRQRFAKLATSLVPLGLAAWMAFSLSLALTNGTYVLAALSDPLNLGWDLFGASHSVWQPLLTSGLGSIQSVVLSGGLIWSGNLAHRLASQLRVSPIPILVYMLLLGLALMWLLL